MNSKIQEMCDRNAQNREIVKKITFGEMELVRSAAASFITLSGKDADPERLKECKALLRKKQGLFSDFRKYSELMIISRLSVQEDPEQYLADAMEVYQIIRDGRLFTSEAMAFAAMSIVDAGIKEEAAAVAGKTKELLAEMKERHPFLVDNNDTAFAALLAMTPKSVSQIMEETEACYEILKDTFPLHKDAEYSLCQVLSIYDGDPREKCEKAMRLYQSFADSGIRYGKGHELAFLGVLSNVQGPDEAIVGDVADACSCLKQHHGFGFFSMDKQTLLMFGSLIAASIRSADETGTATAVGSAISMAIVQEIMLVLILVSVSAALQSTRSSSGS